MHDLNKLFIVNISGKFITLILFAMLARLLPSQHLAYVALIPIFAPVLISMFGCGVNTLLERDAPQLLAKKPEEGYALMRSGFVINLFSIVLVVCLGYFFVSTWSPIVLNDYDYNLNTVALMLLPITGYMLLKLVGLMLLLEGKAAKYGMLTIFGDITAKVAVLSLYFLNPSELSVFIGLAIGQLPLIAYGIWLQRAWLFRWQFKPFAKLLKSSVPFYIESNFNEARNNGDSLLVSSLLGPVALAGYYIAKMVANQLSVFFNPINSFMVHRLSFQKGKSIVDMEKAFKQVWHLSVPSFIWLACSVAAIAPLLIQLIAGEQYIYVWPASFILCLVSCNLALNSFSSRILLLIGNAFERFRITLIQVMIIIILTVILAPLFSINGIALAWLLGTATSLAIGKKRSILLGFHWPSFRIFRKSLLITLLTPLASLASYYYYSSVFVLLVIAIPMGIMSFLFILYEQNEYEYEQMLLVLPSAIKPFYIWLKGKKNVANV